MRIKFKDRFLSFTAIAKLTTRTQITGPVTSSANERNGVVYCESLSIESYAAVSALPAKIFYPGVERIWTANSLGFYSASASSALPSLEQFRKLLASFLQILGNMLFVILIPSTIFFFNLIPMFLLVSATLFAVLFRIFLSPLATSFEGPLRKFSVMLPACYPACLGIQSSLFAVSGVYGVFVALSIFYAVTLCFFWMAAHPFLSGCKNPGFIFYVLFSEAHSASARAPNKWPSYLRWEGIPAFTQHLAVSLP